MLTSTTYASYLLNFKVHPTHPNHQKKGFLKIVASWKNKQKKKPNKWLLSDSTDFTDYRIISIDVITEAIEKSAL